MVLKKDAKDMTSTNLDNSKERQKQDSNVYGVIGICGVVGNLIARMLMDHKCHVIGTDMHGCEECQYLYTLD